MESEKPWNLAANTAKKEVQAEHLSWVTDDEDNLLQVLRSGLNANNPSANMAANPGFAQPPAAAKKTAARDPGLKKTVKPAPVKNLSAAKQNRTEQTLAPEDMLALIQAGEKALRGGEPAIKVIR